MHRSTTSRGRRTLALALLLAVAGDGARVGARDTVDAETMARIQEAITDAVRQRLGAGADVHIERVRASMTALAADVVAVPEPGARLGRAVRFSLSSNARTARVGSAVADVSVRVAHARATRPVGRGAILTADDVTAHDGILTAAWLRRLPTSGDVVGARAARDIAAGEIIEQHVLNRPPMVASGQLVSLAVRVGGLVVRGRARASQQGEYGDVIRLVNPESGRTVRGRIVGPGAVEVVQ